MLSKYFELFKKIDLVKYVFTLSSGFYFLLWFASPNNKVVLLMFILLFAVFQYKLKNFRYSLLLTYFASLLISVGKTYELQLIPPGTYLDAWYSNGYRVTYVISPTIIITFFILLTLVRDLLNRNIDKMGFEFNLYDLFLILFFVSTVFTDIFVSSLPYVSALLGVTGLGVVVVFFYIRCYSPKFKGLLIVLFALICAQILFESFVALQQFIFSSPISSSIQGNLAMNQFGNAPDEIMFRFRPTGTMGHANDLAAWLTPHLLLVFSSFYIKRRQNYYLLLLLGLVVLVLTLSRAAWIGFFVGAAFLLSVFEKKMKLKPPKFVIAKTNVSLIFLGMFLVVFFVFPRFEKTFFVKEGGLEFRQLQIKSITPVIKRNFLFGVGSSMSVVESYNEVPGSFFKKVPLSLHNWYLLYLTEHGVLSLIFLFAFTILIFNKILKNTGDKDFELWKWGLLSGSFALGIIAFLQPYLWESLIIYYSGIIVSSND